jgi:hypothetical protein
MGTREARERLKSLAGGAEGAVVTTTAAAVLDRLGK